MKKVSVIIPVYNVELYIDRCIQSVIDQTYTNLEIICVDDGSTDNSGKICDDYAKKDKRIMVIHKKNQGVSSARNIAIEKVTGDYVGFVDSDDWLDTDMYQTLVNMMEYSDVDMACCNYSKVYDEKKVCMSNQWPVKDGILDPYDIIYYAFNRDHYMGFGAYLWNKLFKAEDIKKYKLSESIKIGEDILYFTDIITHTNARAVYNIKSMYNYYQRNDSAMKNIDIRFHSLNAYSKCIDLLYADKKYNESLIWVKRFYCYHASIIVEWAYNNNKKEKVIEYQQEIKRYLPEYIKTNSEYPDRIDRIYKLLSV